MIGRIEDDTCGSSVPPTDQESANTPAEADRPITELREASDLFATPIAGAPIEIDEVGGSVVSTETLARLLAKRPSVEAISNTDTLPETAEVRGSPGDPDNDS
jgi:hypothetical protein